MHVDITYFPKTDQYYGVDSASTPMNPLNHIIRYRLTDLYKTQISARAFINRAMLNAETSHGSSCRLVDISVDVF